MDELSLIVGAHAVALAAILYVSCQSIPYLWRNLRTVLSNPVGLILLAFFALSAVFAHDSVFYGGGRVLKHLGIADVWSREFAEFVSAMRLFVPAACLLVMVAHWRLRDMTTRQVWRRVGTAVLIAVAIFTGVVSALW